MPKKRRPPGGRKITTQQELDEEIKKQQANMDSKKLGEILARSGFISGGTEALSKQLGMPIVKLSEREISERILGLVDVRIAQLYRVIPIDEEGGLLMIATADPTDTHLLENLERLIERPVKPLLSAPEEISSALVKYYGLDEDSEGEVE